MMRVKSAIYPQYISSFLLDTIFPIRCIGCGSFSPEKSREYLCKSCLKLLPVRTSLECIGCEKPSVLGKTCFECKDRFSIDQLMVISDYRNPLLRKTIKTLKYRLIPDMAKSLEPVIKKYLAGMAKKGLNIMDGSPIILPIPLHSRRLNSRGFNQAELIADIVAGYVLAGMNENPLQRITDSKPQADIKIKGERAKNVAGIFKFTGKTDIKNRTCILIDDVCTTGATLNEAAKVLKANGASRVIGFVIARG